MPAQLLAPARPSDPRLARIDRFVADTRAALFVRREDRLLMIRPDKTLALNDSAVAILSELYARSSPGAAAVLDRLAGCLDVAPERLLLDTEALVDAVGAVLNEDFAPRPGLRFATFDRSAVGFPTLAEIALTYGCQNRCVFCYAASPDRSRERRMMTTAEVCTVMDKIAHEAHVPSLSFTGGESSLRADLPELIRHGQRLGLRVNLITNGLRAADPDYAKTLVDAGLASAQVSLEAGDAAGHDAIVCRPGAFAQTVAGVENLRRLGIHVHTNTTLCSANLDQAGGLVRFVARDLGLSILSMNMVIRTGLALAGPDPVGVTYAQVAARLPGLLALAAAEGVRLVWYSPIPYCIFNPVLHGLGAKSCACVDGILSIDPAGQVLPCSSFETGIGSLLEQPFARIYASRKARYWRQKRFVPPACRECRDVDVCAGACPLYWDAAGSFAELPRPGALDSGTRRRWERGRRRGGSFGVQPRLRESV
jgi:radical SAM protein with 4Fe4S-binding SPASM domain